MNEKQVIMLGAGGHARVLLDVLKNCKLNVHGILDPGLDPGTVVMGIPVLGDDSYILEKTVVDNVFLINGVGSLPGQNLRWRLSEIFRKKGYGFLTVIHPQSIISEGVNLANGAQVMAGCTLQTGVTVGKDSIINTGSILDHDCVIGDCCHVAPGCTLSGGVQVGKNSHLGTGTNVIQNIFISEGTVVGAGSTIFTDISSFKKVIQKKDYGPMQDK